MRTDDGHLRRELEKMVHTVTRFSRQLKLGHRVRWKRRDEMRLRDALDALGWTGGRLEGRGKLYHATHNGDDTMKRFSFDIAGLKMDASVGFASPDKGLNPGIVETVAFLRENGFDTSDSGDGKTHDCECDRDYAYVVMRCDPTRLIDMTGRVVLMLGTIGVDVRPIGPEDERTPWIQGTYDPVARSAFIELCNVDDEMLRACRAKTEADWAAKAKTDAG